MTMLLVLCKVIPAQGRDDESKEDPGTVAGVTK